MRGKADEPAGRGIHERCRAVGLAVASALGMRKEAVDMDAGLTCAVAAQLRNLGLALSSARAQAAILLCACARARTATLPCSVCLLPRRRPGLLLRALRIAARGTSGRWRGAAGKAHALWPLVAVIVSVCHSNHLASCVTCLSYIKRCTTHGYVRQKPDKWYERCRAAHHGSRQQVSKSRQDESVQDEWRLPPFVPKTAPLVLQFCLRSSLGRRCCAKAVS